MIPAGLTCARCERALYPEIARLDGEVYVHAGRCGCGIDGCDAKYEAKGYCHTHYQRLRKYGHPLGGVSIELEDVEWMVETGESFEGAAARLGTTPKKLDDVLRRRGRGDLVRAFRRLEVAA